jgi:hypothetical protein
MLTNLFFSLVCISLGWLMMSRIEPIVRYAGRPTSFRHRGLMPFLKAFSAFLALLWALSLWTASVAIWVNRPLAWMLATMVPIMAVVGLIVARALAQRR